MGPSCVKRSGSTIRKNETSVAFKLPHDPQHSNNPFQERIVPKGVGHEVRKDTVAGEVLKCQAVAGAPTFDVE